MSEVPPNDDVSPRGLAEHDHSELRQRRRRRRRSSSNGNTRIFWSAAVSVVLIGILLGGLLLTPGNTERTDKTKPGSVKSTDSQPTPPQLEPIYGGYPLAHWEREMELANNEEQIRRSAEALRAFGRKGVPGLVRGLAHHKSDTELPKPIVDALGEIGEEGLPELDRLQADRDLKIQKAVPLARLLMKPVGKKNSSRPEQN